jgi:hypothetical protein
MIALNVALGKGKITFPSRLPEGQCGSCCNIPITLIEGSATPR